MDQNSKQPQLMEGFRALDLTDEKGLMCGQLLGGLGVDVIKVERPGGDAARQLPPFYKDEEDPEKSLYWLCNNRNKRGITLDIKSDKGRDIFLKMVETTDFVFESFDPGFMDSIGLGYDDLEKVNPRVILTSITPFGQTGPYSQYKFSDLVQAAMGSIMPGCGEGDRPPVRTPYQMAFYGGIHGALGSMTAHYGRQTSGEGQHVDVSIQQAGILTLMNGVESWDLLRIHLPRMGQTYYAPRENDLLEVRTVYPCKDGWVFAHYSGGPTGIINSSNVMLRLAEEAGFAGKYAGFDFADIDGQTITQEERFGLEEVLSKYLKTKTKNELMEIAVEKRMILGPIFSIKEIWDSPHFKERDFWVDVKHPELGDTITYPGAPVKIHGAPWKMDARAPQIGEHNREVLIDECGITAEEFSELENQGVI
jgi:crotonobetainyl-CoA:carnitine CoA-transferase CaiB-like acyl-CoA transferase